MNILKDFNGTYVDYMGIARLAIVVSAEYAGSLVGL